MRFEMNIEKRHLYLFSLVAFILAIGIVVAVVPNPGHTMNSIESLDVNNNGIPDNSEKLGGLLPSAYTPCDQKACALSDDTNYRFTSLDFTGTTGFDDGIDNGGAGSVTKVDTSSGLTGGPITTTGTISIATGGITAAHLADDSVTTAKIANAAVTSAEIAPNSIIDAKVASNANIAQSKLEGNPKAAGTINDPNNPIHWTKLTSVPSGFADGTDDIGGDIVCPSGFTGVTSQGRQLGCIETSESSGGMQTWDSASDFCFDNFGARLPTQHEGFIAMTNFPLNAETDDEEWKADACNSGTYIASPVNGVMSDTNCRSSSITRAFRCFMPR